METLAVKLRDTEAFGADVLKVKFPGEKDRISEDGSYFSTLKAIWFGVTSRKTSREEKREELTCMIKERFEGALNHSL